jgi:hypothetical protein
MTPGNDFLGAFFLGFGVVLDAEVEVEVEGVDEEVVGSGGDIAGGNGAACFNNTALMAYLVSSDSVYFKGRDRTA